ncbi:predicted protein [Sclerotinia sclerotiorum 1980 UF-70]|uniref:Uncharacterized protein n=1 Tax=Sclerotinia sclerotiorum (strain ATCC 18683 / 1980 / Ss-1) TaxID=665079 RepID=A7EUJ1_SCLS1|nr:predicted protein [Sclerotinia sclerotiorum 1980 UF-70]EDN93133.1 predicted protein [Sclerotinia sclerotiorum 1980 UF-70]
METGIAVTAFEFESGIDSKRRERGPIIRI